MVGLSRCFFLASSGAPSVTIVESFRRIVLCFRSRDGVCLVLSPRLVFGLVRVCGPRVEKQNKKKRAGCTEIVENVSSLMVSPAMVGGHSSALPASLVRRNR